jgi:RNA-directed DNA polymerase
VNRVAQAIVEEKIRIIDIDLRAYFDNVQHFLLLEQVARRVQDDEVMHLLKMMLQATGEKGVPQGGVISPLLSNLYLNEVDRMLEKAIATTRRGPSTRGIGQTSGGDQRRQKPDGGSIEGRDVFPPGL